MRLMPSHAPRIESEHLLLLKGLLLLALIAVAFMAALHYGLVQRVWREDPTGMSSMITVVFLLAAVHSSQQFVRLSRALNQMDQVEGVVRRQELLGGLHEDPAMPTFLGLPPGSAVRGHLERLASKARFGGPRPIDQTLLLDSFEGELRRSHHFGWFVADLLLTLGLLGTVVGFILMLSPISGLESDDHGAIRHALTVMGGGMAVALYTTLTGLIGGTLLKIQGLLLDGAVEELVQRMTQVTEVYVLPRIERRRLDAAA